MLLQVVWQIIICITSLITLITAASWIRNSPSYKLILCFLLIYTSLGNILQLFATSDYPLLYTGAFYFQTAASLWYLMFALDISLSTLNPFLPYHHGNPVFHNLVVTPVAFAYVTVNQLRNTNEQKLDNNHQYYPTFHFSWRLPRYILIVIMAALFCLTWRISRKFQLEAHGTTRRQARVCLRYLIFCFFGGMSAIIISITTTSNSANASQWIQLTDAIELLGIFLLFTRDMREDAAMNQEDISSTLRSELIKYTAMGISASVDKVSAASSNSVYIDLGTDQSQHIDIYVRGARKGMTLAFQDVAPLRFALLRELDNISLSEYQDAFHARDSSFNERGSEGKSGNLFYFTPNRKFLVKTIPQDEFEVLRSILPAYHEFIMKHPNSLICRFYGCHSIKLPIGYRRMYFVVLQNLLPPTGVDQRFDLKGNTDARTAIRSKNVLPYIKASRKGSVIRKLMLDIDYLKMHTRLNNPPHHVQHQIQRTILHDFSFLSQCGLMDYSLLVGVKFKSNEEDVFVKNSYESYDTRRRYYVGVIDILQRYNWRWKLQRLALGYGLCKGVHDISAVPPGAYALRLSQFIQFKFFADPNTNVISSNVLECEEEECPPRSSSIVLYQPPKVNLV